MKKWLALLALSLTGCVTSTTFYRTSALPNRPAVHPDSVRVLYAAPAEPFEVIGIVGAEGGVLAPQGKYERALQRKAAQVGGDAVIITGAGANTYGAVFYSTPHMTTAVPVSSWATQGVVIVFHKAPS